MNIFAILPYYVSWHYSVAISDLLRIWKDFLVFIYNFFSIKDLALSLFSPWQRMQEGLRKGYGLEELFGAIIVNTIMRLVGAVVRLIFIVLGVVLIVAGLFLGLGVLCLWLTLPFVFVYLLTTAASLLI